MGCVSITDLLNSAYEPFKNDVAAGALNVEGTIVEYNQSRAALIDQQKVVSSLKFGCDLGARESEVQVHIDKYL